jgi:hypothetical protein
MAHEGPDCGQVCYCDMEDHEQPAPDDCLHVCDGEEDSFDDFMTSDQQDEWCRNNSTPASPR